MWDIFLKHQVVRIQARIAASGGSGPTHVYTTGHSLGAVNAQYAAAAIRLAGLQVTGVYAFASPNTGGKGNTFNLFNPGHSWAARYRWAKPSLT